MKVNRRSFIKKASIVTTMSALFPQLVGCNSSASSEETVDSVEALFTNYGIQLWSVKEDMAKDPKATLKSLAEFGYKQIESFSGEKGIFWGLSASDFKTFTSDLGLSVISSHCNPAFTIDPSTKDEFKKLAEDAALVGLKYLINPFPGQFTTKDEWLRAAEGLNIQGEVCKQNGLKVGYHNHHFEFERLSDGSMPEKLLLDNTDPSLVDFELDLYWIIKAGEDPKKWLSDYEGRFKLCHVKDLHKQERINQILSTEKQEDSFWPIGLSCKLGDGQIDYEDLLPFTKGKGMEYFIVEQERFDNSSPLKDIEANALFMNKFSKV